MFRPECPQPAGHLITPALAEKGVYTKLRRPNGDCRVVAVNDCNDDRTIWNKIEKIMSILNVDGMPTCSALPVPFFSGLCGISSYCPGYTREDVQAFLKQLRIGVQRRQARVIFGGAHGEECGFCSAEGITVAQRQWLARDAKRVIMRTAEVEQWTAPNDPIHVCVTWHRRYLKDGQECQKTRVIGVNHLLFEQISMAEIMRLTDQQVLEQVAPHLLELVEV